MSDAKFDRNLPPHTRRESVPGGRGRRRGKGRAVHVLSPEQLAELPRLREKARQLSLLRDEQRELSNAVAAAKAAQKHLLAARDLRKLRAFPGLRDGLHEPSAAAELQSEFDAFLISGDDPMLESWRGAWGGSFLERLASLRVVMSSLSLCSRALIEELLAGAYVEGAPVDTESDEGVFVGVLRSHGFSNSHIALVLGDGAATHRTESLRRRAERLAERELPAEVRAGMEVYEAAMKKSEAELVAKLAAAEPGSAECAQVERQLKHARDARGEFGARRVAGIMPAIAMMISDTPLRKQRPLSPGRSPQGAPRSGNRRKENADERSRARKSKRSKARR